MAALADLHALPPILNPSEMIYAAANYDGHISESLEVWQAPKTESSN